MTNEELAVLAQRGDQAAMLQLWNQVKRLIEQKAWYQLPKDGHTSRVELDDLMQAGYFAMVNAVKDFYSDSGYTFTTYLALHLKTAFAQELGYRTSRRDALLFAVPIDAPVGSNVDGKALTIADTLVAPDAETAFDDIQNRMEAEQSMTVVMEQMKKLDKQQSEVIEKHYLYGLTLPTVAAQTGFTLKDTQRHKDAGLRRLRRLPAMRKLGKQLFSDLQTNFYLHIGVTSFQSGSGSAVELLTERRNEFLK